MAGGGGGGGEGGGGVHANWLFSVCYPVEIDAVMRTYTCRYVLMA